MICVKLGKLTGYALDRRRGIGGGIRQRVAGVVVELGGAGCVFVPFVCGIHRCLGGGGSLKWVIFLSSGWGWADEA